MTLAASCPGCGVMGAGCICPILYPGQDPTTVGRLATSIADLDTWRPIATAPKDGTPVLLFEKGIFGLGAWFDDGMKTHAGKPMSPTWIYAVCLSELTPIRQNGKPVDHLKLFTCRGGNPTHWRPLVGPVPT